MSTCQTPVPFAALVDYWAATLPEHEEHRLEEHCFECEPCSRRLEVVAALAHGVASVARRRGGIAMSMTRSLVDRLSGEGIRMRHYRVVPGDRVPCTVGATDDLLVTWLTADLGGSGRVDIEVCDVQGKVIQRIEDAPVDRASDQVIYTVAGDVARTWPAMTVRVRLVEPRADRRRVLGEYTFDHSPPQPSA